MTDENFSPDQPPIIPSEDQHRFSLRDRIMVTGGCAILGASLYAEIQMDNFLSAESFPKVLLADTAAVVGLVMVLTVPEMSRRMGRPIARVRNFFHHRQQG